MSDFEVQNKTSGWLRTLIFGKKNKFHSRKRVPCIHCLNNRKDQTVQTNVTDEKTSNGNTYCDTRSLQRYEECGGKSFSVQQIGNGGLRIYFCIGNPGKINLSRANKVKMGKNEKNMDSFLELDNRSISQISETKISPILISNKFDQSFAFMNNENTSDSDVDLRAREMMFSETNPTEETQQHESVSSEPIKSEMSEIISVTPRNLEANLSTQEGSTLQLSNSQSQLVLEPPSPKKQSLTSLPSYKNYAERQLYVTEIDHVESSSRKQDESIIEEDNVFKEYDTFQQHKVNRKSLMKSKSRLSQNSFTGIRKKRESYVNMIPEIISKLDNIEEKLNEIEKVQEYRGENIIKTKRISYNHARRASPSDLVNLHKTFWISKGSREEISNKKTSNLKPPKVISHKVHPVLIKSCGEEVYINAPQSVCVVKKIRSDQESSGDKQLVFHNTQQLDAHNITSTSVSKISSIKSINSKPAKKHNKKTKSDMWRRISEE